MFGLSEISWSSFLLATALLLLAFNAGVWLYFRFQSNRPQDKNQQHRQQKFHQSLPF